MPENKALRAYTPQPPARKEELRTMFSVQANLPRLPVPLLASTMQKYLEAIRPLTDEQEFSNTTKLINTFSSPGSLGPELQAALERRAKEKDSWLEQWWLEHAYLGYREPVVINSSPGIVLPLQHYNSQREQAHWAALLLAGALDFKAMIDEQTLPVDTLGGKPLCMIQYCKIFNSCRIPCDVKDKIKYFSSVQPESPQHIIVLHNGHFFKLNVYTSNRTPLGSAQLEATFLEIMKASEEPAKYPVGALSGQHRDVWSKQYAMLEEDNGDILGSIERSIIVLCLDSPLSDKKCKRDKLSNACANMLHGAGVNSVNRWFDKTMQLIVTQDGGSGICYEHAPAEGLPIMALVDHMYAFATKIDNSSASTVGAVAFKQLHFCLETVTENHIERARLDISQKIANLDLQVLSFSDFGKNFPKSQKLSPDAFIQVAIQLAYFRLHGKACASYESGSLRMFQLGRTDTIRSCSPASVEFTTAMQSDASEEEKRKKLRHAVIAHKAFSNQTISGQGIDRHLLGLRLTAEKLQLPTPELFTDTVFARAMHFNLSTSQVPAKSESLLCFGPTVSNGYGICYNPQETLLLFAVSTFNSCTSTRTEDMVNGLKQALSDMRNLLLSEEKTKL